MYKAISFLNALIFSIQIGNSQENKFSMSLKPDDSWTNRLMHFSCIIHNSSNKVVKVIPLSHDCDNKYYPLFWKIHVKRNDQEYNTDTIVLLGQPSLNELIKIHSESNYEFSFCIDFSALIPVNKDNQQTNIITDVNKNLDYGLYTIQIQYISNLKIRRQIENLLSNEVSIIYKNSTNP